MHFLTSVHNMFSNIKNHTIKMLFCMNSKKNLQGFLLACPCISFSAGEKIFPVKIIDEGCQQLLVAEQVHLLTHFDWKNNSLKDKIHYFSKLIINKSRNCFIKFEFPPELAINLVEIICFNRNIKSMLTNYFWQNLFLSNFD